MGGIKIRGLGHQVPEHVLSNQDLEKMMDTSDEWIKTRTGISRRHISRGETLLSMSAEAARAAMEQAGITVDQIGACIVATLTPDKLIPAAACELQKELGMPEDIIAFDLNAACSGFVFALHTMEGLLASSERKFGLVIGAEELSHIVNWDDRGTCILFGDGAGAAIVEYRDDWETMPFVSGVRGDDELLYAPGPGQKEPTLIAMEGKKVFRFAVETIPASIHKLLSRTGKTMEEIDYFILHQANARILDSAAKKCQIPQEKLGKNLQEYGNTSAASVPILMSESFQSGKIGSGDQLMLVAFGGGMTWGGVITEIAAKC